MIIRNQGRKGAVARDKGATIVRIERETGVGYRDGVVLEARVEGGTRVKIHLLTSELAQINKVNETGLTFTRAAEAAKEG